MTKYTPEEIKNRLSNIGEAIGSIALEYIVELEKENEQLKAQIEKMKCCANCKYGKQGDPDYNRECYYCDVDRCICAVTRNKMTWDEKCDEWGLAE